MNYVVIKTFDTSYSYFNNGIGLLGFLLMIGVIIFILTLSWLIRKEPLRFNIKESQQLENYTLGFIAAQEETNSVSYFSKSILFVMAAIFIYTPFSEILQQLGPYYGNSAWNWLVW